MDWNSGTSFDGWVTLKCLGNRMKIVLPVKRTSHFNATEKRGVLKKGIRLSYHSATFMFDIPDPPKRTTGRIIGIDKGLIDSIACSNGVQAQKDIHGWTLGKIVDKICRRRKGGKGFQKAIAHRKNYINWSINQLNLTDIKTIKIEDIKDIRRGKRCSRQWSHWVYTEIDDKLERLCEDTGVQLLKVSPMFTSQRCSVCGWVQKANRIRKRFKCKACGHEQDADLNASMNIGFDLSPLKKDWRSLNNKTGFYWDRKDQEPIVPDAQEIVV
jgi:IS605 OrfB family transposase